MTHLNKLSSALSMTVRRVSILGHGDLFGPCFSRFESAQIPKLAFDNEEEEEEEEEKDEEEGGGGGGEEEEGRRRKHACSQQKLFILLSYVCS
ncbi:hypothetical protein M8J77_021244 [Diaphorina citri]|nr:hypothetical protein M8J77_021244 [Diaphorina citri]